jgi:hypothetical protein
MEMNMATPHQAATQAASHQRSGINSTRKLSTRPKVANSGIGKAGRYNTERVEVICSMVESSKGFIRPTQPCALRAGGFAVAQLEPAAWKETFVEQCAWSAMFEELCMGEQL